MFFMSKRVPTDKPRIQGYISPETHRLFIDFQRGKGCSQSVALEFLIKAYLGINPQKLEILKMWAESEHRMVEQQAQAILEKAIDEWAKENLTLE